MIIMNIIMNTIMTIIMIIIIITIILIVIVIVIVMAIIVMIVLQNRTTMFLYDTGPRQYLSRLNRYPLTLLAIERVGGSERGLSVWASGGVGGWPRDTPRAHMRDAK